MTGTASIWLRSQQVCGRVGIKLQSLKSLPHALAPGSSLCVAYLCFAQPGRGAFMVFLCECCSEQWKISSLAEILFHSLSFAV